jgi:hypothetical protein
VMGGNITSIEWRDRRSSLRWRGRRRCRNEDQHVRNPTPPIPFDNGANSRKTKLHPRIRPGPNRKRPALPTPHLAALGTDENLAERLCLRSRNKTCTIRVHMSTADPDTAEALQRDDISVSDGNIVNCWCSSTCQDDQRGHKSSCTQGASEQASLEHPRYRSSLPLWAPL